MDIGVISVRYARALLKAALAAKQEEQVYGEMQTLAQSYVHVPELRFTINNPMLEKGKKENLLLTACGKNPSKLTSDFIHLANSYITLYRKQKNLISGRLITAAAVAPATEQKLRQMVESKTRGTVEFQTEINPEIIGGFVLEYDTYRMDASVKTKLKKILSELQK